MSIHPFSLLAASQEINHLRISLSNSENYIRLLASTMEVTKQKCATDPQLLQTNWASYITIPEIRKLTFSVL